jgi:uncharacterized protein (TIGR03083 family)
MTAPTPLPAGLRDRVLAAAQAGRAWGRPVPAAPTITAAEGFSRAADAFHSLLTSLEGDDWRIAVLRDLDVQGLVGHLTGVELDMQCALRGDPSVADADHVVSTQRAATEQVGRDPHQTQAEWRQAVDQTLALVRRADADTHTQTDGAVLSMHGMRLSLDALLVVRAFELWTHDNDVRRVLGLAASAPDPSTLTLMTDLAVKMLPHGVRRTQSVPSSVHLHLVLTGAGGGTWDIPFGNHDSEANAEDVVLVADAVDFCRMVANRVDRATLELHTSGAHAHVEGILQAAASLALD